MKITHRKLRQIIKEEMVRPLRESIMDATPMDDLIGTMVGEFTDRMRDMAGEIVDRFGNEMGRLWDEDPALMREQGYTDKSQWTSQVGSAEIALENELQQVMKSDDEQEDKLYQAIKRAVEEAEARLHSGAYHDDDPDDDSDDAAELRDIADDLEGEGEKPLKLSAPTRSPWQLKAELGLGQGTGPYSKAGKRKPGWRSPLSRDSKK